MTRTISMGLCKHPTLIQGIAPLGKKPCVLGRHPPPLPAPGNPHPRPISWGLPFLGISCERNRMACVTGFLNSACFKVPPCDLCEHVTASEGGNSPCVRASG